MAILSGVITIDLIMNLSVLTDTCVSESQNACLRYDKVVKIRTFACYARLSGHRWNIGVCRCRSIPKIRRSIRDFLCINFLGWKAWEHRFGYAFLELPVRMKLFDNICPKDIRLTIFGGAL